MGHSIAICPTDLSGSFRLKQDNNVSPYPPWQQVDGQVLDDRFSFVFVRVIYREASITMAQRYAVREKVVS